MATLDFLGVLCLLSSYSALLLCMNSALKWHEQLSTVYMCVLMEISSDQVLWIKRECGSVFLLSTHQSSVETNRVLPLHSDMWRRYVMSILQE